MKITPEYLRELTAVAIEKHRQYEMQWLENEGYKEMADRARRGDSNCFIGNRSYAADELKRRGYQIGESAMGFVVSWDNFFNL